MRVRGSGAPSASRHLGRAFNLVLLACGQFVVLTLLAGYVVLLRAGPSLKSDEWLTIQAAGQKVIVYASIGCISPQAWGARKLSNLAQL